jgi:hypothetical protein
VAVSARLFVLLARKEPVGLVFRRGPSKQVLLVRWDRRDDTFEAGQWLKGRIYEERCDLSPRGDHLFYFAASWRPPFQTWTAVSRPPYLTALALWPKGDAWGGGGLFKNQRELLLNHAANQRKLADGFSIPQTFEIGALPRAGSGEDGPIASVRLQREGWSLVQTARAVTRSKKGLSYKFEPPEIWAKPCPNARVRRVLRMCTDGIYERGGPWYVRRFELQGGPHDPLVDLGRADWGDWDASGDLLLARDGKIHRVPRASVAVPNPWTKARVLIDLSPLTFEPRQAPPEATRWIGPPPPAPRIR